jgi:hypothetical protein
MLSKFKQNTKFSELIKRSFSTNKIILSGGHNTILPHGDNIARPDQPIDRSYIYSKHQILEPKKKTIWWTINSMIGKDYVKNLMQHERLRTLIHHHTRLTNNDITKIPYPTDYLTIIFLTLAVFYSLFFPIYAYLLLFTKTDFHQKYLLFDFMDIKKPIVGNRGEIDQIKKREDGHWYLKNKRID